MAEKQGWEQMSDGISDAIRSAKAEDRWEKVIKPYVISKLLDKKPEELTQLENEWVWKYYSDMEGDEIRVIRSKFERIRAPFWDAYVGQGEYTHYKYKKQTRVKLK